MKEKIKVGSDFSGVGAFDQALKRLNINHETVFACDMDKFARQTYIKNYGVPDYYPTNVYDRDIPDESLDIYMTSPPCQAFSLAGKRLGKDDLRGVLFFNSYEFIQKNNPRYFIFENVKGLLSDDNGSTFQEWINYLGGKSVNGVPVLFPNDECVNYHIYWKVLNAKNHGVPQNRERVFIVGIRDDSDNVFSWPKEEYLTKNLKDVLESEIDEKYFLSDKMLNGLVSHTERMQMKGNGFNFSPKTGNEKYAASVTTRAGSRPDDNYIKVKSATKQGFEVATENDSINYSVPNSETRRGRVGKGVAQTLDTACNQGVMVGTWRTHKDGNGFREIQDGNCPTIPARAREDGSGQPVICVPVLTPDRVNKRQNGRRFKDDGDPSFTITTQDRHGIFDGFRIRRLTPRECFRLMDFPDSFEWPVSDSQAYKQAGNSIVVRCLELIISKLNF